MTRRLHRQEGGLSALPEAKRAMCGCCRKLTATIQGITVTFACGCPDRQPCHACRRCSSCCLCGPKYDIESLKRRLEME